MVDKEFSIYKDYNFRRNIACKEGKIISRVSTSVITKHYLFYDGSISM